MPGEQTDVTVETPTETQTDSTAPSTPPSTPPVSLVNPDGTYTADWLDRLEVDDEVKGDQQLRTHKGLADTTRNLHELMKMRGHHVVPVPPTGSEDPKLWDAVYDRLGRPESPDKYTQPNVEDIPENQRMPDEMMTAVRQIAHKVGLNDRQWQTLTADWNELVKGQLAAVEAERAKALDPLKAEWAGQFETNVSLTEQFLRSNIPPERLDSAIAAVKTNPDLMKILHERALAMVEGEPELQNTPPSVLAEAERELAKIQASGKDGPYHSRYHPEHDATIKRADELRKLIASAKPKPREEGFSLQL